VVVPKRSEVYYVSFDPTVGVEIRKTRPALIIQNDVGNTHSPATIVAAITATTRETYPYEVSLPAGEGGLPKNSIVLLNQIRTIDKKRLGRKLGTISAETMRKVDRALAISLGLIKT
jgi:mRNA interferase MazF